MDTPKSVLAEKAKEVLKKAYAPYSGFKVGAALLCSDGSIYTGCNIENASYGATICAERVAISKAISEGQRDFIAICIVSDPQNGPCYPCGICRQVLSEHCTDDFEIILPDEMGALNTFTLSSLLPFGFSNKNL
ncbi:MAG: cytidine deaminase [Clostridia bacterium]|nr:cytidine deaminase [Clostridia bacterium]